MDVLVGPASNVRLDEEQIFSMTVAENGASYLTDRTACPAELYPGLEPSVRGAIHESSSYCT